MHYRYNAGSFFANWAAVLLCLLTAQSIGLLVGSTITVPKTGQTVTTIIALTNVLVCQLPFVVLLLNFSHVVHLLLILCWYCFDDTLIVLSSVSWYHLCC